MTALPADQADRRRAASEFDRNLIVRAGAGTGKTELLVERVLTAIGSGRIEIERLAALTFTEKAAGEMRERLALGLDRLRAYSLRGGDETLGGAARRAFEHLASELRIGGEEIARRALAALVSLDRAKITTIHSFCSDLLRAHPREAGVDPTFRVDKGEHFQSLFDTEWTRFLSLTLGPDAPSPKAWGRLLDEVGTGELRQIALGLAAFSFPRSLLAHPYESQDARAVLAGEAEALEARIVHAEAATGLTKTNAEFLRVAREALTDFRSRGPDGLRQGFAAQPARGDRITKGGAELGKKVSGLTELEFRSIQSDAKRLIERLLDLDEDLIARIFEALSPFALAFRETYLARGLVDFDGLLYLTHDLLADHPDVRRAARGRFQMLMVDEFQDTDPIQYEIVLFLAEDGGGAAEDAFAAKLAPGRLFVVGDAKQSIYRFRGADYDAFRRASDRILEEGGADLHLTTNFRSVGGVLDAVNDLMSEAGTAWRELTHQPPYEAVHAHRPPGDLAVDVWTIDAAPARGGAGAAARRAAEGRVLAERIHDWVETGKVCRYGDVTVLLRSFTELSLYLKPLRAAGIPFIVDGGRDFLERPEVGHLLAILRALSSPSDPTALLAYLRSPAGGVPDIELTLHAASGGSWDWRKEADASSVPTLSAALARLRDLDAATRDLPADARIRAAIDATDLLTLSAASFEGAQRVANLRKLARLSSDLARDGTLSLREILDALDSEQFSRTEADSPLADDAADAVRILTIHKAKGLENQRVILADVTREDRSHRDPERVRVARIGGRAVAAIAAGRRANAARVWAEEEERRHEQAEEIRVLYVALTRARDHLSVVLGTPRNRASWVDAFRAWGFDPHALPADGAALAGGRVLHRRWSPADVAATSPPDAIDVEQAVTAYRAAADTLRRASRPEHRRPSAADEPAAPRGGAGDRARARAAGTAVHEPLRRLDFDTGADPLFHVAEVAAAAAADAGAEPGAVARDAREILEEFLRSELAGRLRRAKVLGREVPVLLHEEGAVWSGSLDVLLEENGMLVVADYKTDRDVDAEALATRYGPQLSVYARAVRKALNLAQLPRAELWVLRGGRALVIPPE